MLGLARAQPTWAVPHSALSALRLVRRPADGRDGVYRRQAVAAGEVLSVGELVHYELTSCCRPGRWVGRQRPPTRRLLLCAGDTARRAHAACSLYVQCVSARGHDLLIRADEAPARFSRVGPLDVVDARCVYQLADVARRRALPVYARLVVGASPDAPHAHFTGTLRLERAFYDECLVGCVVDDSDKPAILEVPTDCDVRFVPALNAAAMLDTDQLRSILAYCRVNVDSWLHQMKVVHDVCPHPDAPSGVPTRCLPPLPTPASPPPPGQRARQVSAVPLPQRRADSEPEQETELESVYTADSLYETIPYVYNNLTFATFGHSTCVATPPKQVTWEDEDGYLVPSPSGGARGGRVNAAFSDDVSGDRTVVCVHNSSAIELTLSGGACSCPTCTPLGQTQTDGRSSPVDICSDRLHSFLADSIEELDRLNLSTSFTAPRSLKSSSSCESLSFPNLETNESVGAFLDDIFDCENDAEQKNAVAKNYLPEVCSLNDTTTYSKRIPTLDDTFDTEENYARVTHIPEYVCDAQPSGDQSSRESSPCFFDWSLGHASSRFDSGIDASIYSASSDGGMRRYDDSPCTPALTSRTTPGDVASLTVDDVTQSLRHIGVSELTVERCAQRAMDGKRPAEMSDAMLRVHFPELSSFELGKLVANTKYGRRKT